MNSDLRSRKDTFLEEEYRCAATAINAQNFALAWHHLERAHIIAQDRLAAHCKSHWRMLQLAWRLNDWKEVGGQVFRLALAPVGNITGRLPTGNTGHSDVSAFMKMNIEPELKDILTQDADRNNR